MKVLQFTFLALLVVFYTSCKVSKQLASLNTQAKLAYESADYQKALDSYQQIITINTNKKKTVDGEVYQNAGLAAWELKQKSISIDYLEKAKQTQAANDKTYSTLAKAYLDADNLSREITNLELYVEKYPQGGEIDEINRQLFIAYVESTNWDRALQLWPSLKPEYQSEARVLNGYLKTNKSLGSTDQLKPIAEKLLKIDTNNIDALEALAVHYFNIAEDRYQLEMQLYEKNKTNKQYRQLLNALDEINANFRTSRDYFERLYKLDPKPRYANFLGNIYTRFDNKKQADYYFRKAKEN
jgi:hypothetical protein